MLSIIQAAGWPIWPLIACSIFALALIFERFISLKTARVAPPKLLDEAITVSKERLPSNDVIQQLAQNSALGEVLASGMQQLSAYPKSSEEDLRARMEAEGLYNTAFGLIVAIPALIFWKYFRARVDAYLLQLELASEQFVRHLNRLRIK
nr:MotA/TolQ/ExbB proton channel family protein [Comamonas jiangduensis]